MKKMLLVAVAAVVATAGFSQIRIGGQVIGNASSISYKNAELPPTKQPAAYGVGAGVVADIPLAGNLSLRPSLNFLQKKTKITFKEGGKENSITTSLNYAELPANLVYSIPLNALNIYFSAGPSLGYGISGKMRYQGYVPGDDNEPVKVDEKVDAYKSEENEGGGLKHFEVSANANTGIELKNGLFVNAGYLVGLTNLVKSEGSYKNGSILLTVGFLFGGKK